MKKSRKDHIYEVLSDFSRGLHVRDIAKELAERNFERGISQDDLINKISGALSVDINKYKSKSRFRRVPNNKGGYKQGFYKIKREKKTIADVTIGEMGGAEDGAEGVSNLYTGKAGEFAVLSELLFHGFNASLMSVDQGIDIVASKNDQFFHIQVKTANLKKGNFTTSISRKQFNRYRDVRTFYVLVLRYSVHGKTRSNFIVLSSADIEKFIETGVIGKNDILGLSIRVDKNRLILNNKDSSIDFHLNRFSSIN